MSTINWTKLIEKNKSEIIEKIKEAKRDALDFEYSYHYDVEMNENGEVYITGVHSQNWQTQNSYFGRTIRLIVIHGWTVNVEGYEMEEYLAEKLGITEDELRDRWIWREKEGAKFEDKKYQNDSLFYKERFPEEYSSYEKDYAEAKTNAIEDEIAEYMDTIDIDEIIDEYEECEVITE